MGLNTPDDEEKMRAAARVAHDKARISSSPSIWSATADLWRPLAKRDNAPSWDRFFYAESVLRSGDVETALQVVEVLASEPDLSRPCAMLKAEAYERLNRYAEAETAWRQAGSLPGDNYWPNFGLARVLARQGSLREARVWMNAALKGSGREAGGLRFAARLDLDAGDQTAANAKFDELGLSPDQRVEAIIAAQIGMTSTDERLTLYRLARNAKGKGHFVDLGCFLGSLTIPLALGLRANTGALNAGVQIHAYDLFEWHAKSMDPLYPGTSKPRNSENFHALYLERIRDVSDLVVVHAGDLVKEHWKNGPIEVLSIDAMKNLELGIHICREFYPNLIPAVSYVLHQDFCHFLTWWIHIMQYLGREFFEAVDSIPRSAGVLFRCTRLISESDARAMSTWDLHDASLAEAAFAHSFSIISPEDAHAVAAAHARWHLTMGEPSSAEALLKSYQSKFPFSSEIGAVQAEFKSRRS